MGFLKDDVRAQKGLRTLAAMAARSDAAASLAAGRARHISRLLRAAGFTMANTRDRYKWTEGYHVHRIGCSGSISVGYHVPHYALNTDAERAHIQAMLVQARELLAKHGYAMDDRGWIEGRTEVPKPEEMRDPITSQPCTLEYLRSHPLTCGRCRDTISADEYRGACNPPLCDACHREEPNGRGSIAVSSRVHK